MIVKKKKTRFADDYSARLIDLYTQGEKTAPDASTAEKMAFTTQTQKDLAENIQTCGNCSQFERDQVGDGTGLGNCKLNKNPRQLKWPGTLACEDWTKLL